MAEITREQIIHDGAIDYLLRGCQRVFDSGDEDRDVLPYPHYLFYRTETYLHDLVRFAHEISNKKPMMNRDKLVAGLSYGAYIVNKSGALDARDLRIKTESFTTPDEDIDGRIEIFEELAKSDSIRELHGEYPLPENRSLHGKNYDLGVRAMLAAGYCVLTDPVELINSQETKNWFEETGRFLKDKSTVLSSQILIEINY
jgi:hypothetical protein